jgi:hypothetical protein
MWIDGVNYDEERAEGGYDDNIGIKKIKWVKKNKHNLNIKFIATYTPLTTQHINAIESCGTTIWSPWRKLVVKSMLRIYNGNGKIVARETQNSEAD